MPVKKKAKPAAKKKVKKAAVGTTWTKAEINKLTVGYKKKSASQLAKELKRTLASVRGKISALGLTKGPVKKKAAPKKKVVKKKAAPKKKVAKKKAAPKKKVAKKKAAPKKKVAKKKAAPKKKVAKKKAAPKKKVAKKKATKKKK